MEHHTFQSRHLVYGDYDPKDSSLTITFLNGLRRRYQMVPQDVWRQFKESPSPGTFFHKTFKPRFPSKREY